MVIYSLCDYITGSFQVSSDLNTPHAPHPRFSQYKMRYSNMDQHERRRRTLRLQKECVFNTICQNFDLNDYMWPSVLFMTYFRETKFKEI